MIARTAIYNPWIFSRLDRENVSPDLVRATVERHLKLNQEFYGPDRGIVLFRKYVARYLSPYRLSVEQRQRLLTCNLADEFLVMIDEMTQH